ncbi:hypothetical protein [Polyangium spumosum]|uniref:Uncharacterized protein n=1 Tax=Polyangium spumosum TaxID=889282 RepID=A0A6N7PNJ9_9BACT|nr:hypothetical protein [Polyangium spumosum]MRG92386.1 hypothetical protein [Polyangium spumosum]
MRNMGVASTPAPTAKKPAPKTNPKIRSPVDVVSGPIGMGACGAGAGYKETLGDAFCLARRTPLWSRNAQTVFLGVTSLLEPLPALPPYVVGRLLQLDPEERLPLLDERLPLLLLLDERLLLPDEREPPLNELPPPGRAEASSLGHKSRSERSADPRSRSIRLMVTSPRR